MATTRPWSALPRELGELLATGLDDVVDDVISAVRSDVAEYRRPLEGTFGTGVRVGVAVALGRFLELPGTAEPALSPDDREVYVELGRGEVRQGRTMASLLAAYRTGARVALRRFAADSATAGLDAELLLPLAESIFLYIDELSAASVEGYAQAQTARAGEVERTRAELLARVLAGGADRTSLGDLAGRAGWRLPAEVVVAVVPASAAAGLALRLGDGALVAERAESHVAVVPAPARPADRAQLRRALGQTTAHIGLPVPLDRAPVSLRTAELAAAAVPATPLQGVVWADEHVPALLLRRDPDLTGHLVTTLLAPLDAVREGTRDRLAETLLAWLAHRGERARIAAELHVHPQTVGYRLTQLRELFGEALDDPDRRFALELALRANSGAAAR